MFPLPLDGPFLNVENLFSTIMDRYTAKLKMVKLSLSSWDQPGGFGSSQGVVESHIFLILIAHLVYVFAV